MSEPSTTPTGARARGRSNGDGDGTLRDRVRSLRLGGPGSKPVKPRSAWLPWGLTLLAFATAAVFGWRAYRLSPESYAAPPAAESSSDQKASTPARQSSPSSSAAPGEVVLDAKGYVIAAHQIQLSPQVGGEIIWLDPYFKEGAVYQQGAKLAEVDQEIYRAQVKSAEANVHIAEVNHQQVEPGGSAELEIAANKAWLKNLEAKLDISKIDEHNKRAAGIAVTSDDRDKAVVQLRVDQATIEQQRQMIRKMETALLENRRLTAGQLDVARANLEQAKKQLRNCTIVAPVDGIVLSKKAEEHAYVNPLAFGAAGYLCEMADLTKLEVELDIQERDISRVKEGQRCRIMPEAWQRDEAFLKTHPDGYVGIVSRRIPIANRSKGAVTVRVSVEIPPNEKGGTYLLPDMGVLVSFLK